VTEEKPEAQSAEKPAGTAKKKQTLMMMGVLLGVMAVEGAGVYCAVKYLGGGPKVVAAEGLASAAKSAGGHGEGGESAEGEKAAVASKDAELLVVKFKAPNMKSGRLFLYDIEVYAKTRREKADTLKKTIENYKATIEDRLNRVVRAAEPQDLQEDGLETIRRQVRHELTQIVGDEKMIEEILIPKCTPFKVEY
jgi:flagellar basal body-associated protein FliL